MSANDTRVVKIPAVEKHEGYYSITVRLSWVCPVCGGPRGEVTEVNSYDGSRRLLVDGWVNPCGHVDTYEEVRQEALENGMNGKRFHAF